MYMPFATVFLSTEKFALFVVVRGGGKCAMWV